MPVQPESVSGEQHANPVRAAFVVLLRMVVVVVTVYPALRAFTEYTHRVATFNSYGMPWPEAVVPVTGVVEFVAIVAVGLGIAGRLGAGALVVGMLVAIFAADPNPFNVLVLIASVGLAVLGTGPYSYWDPTLRRLLRSFTFFASGSRPERD